jgi:hypothetical protein
MINLSSMAGVKEIDGIKVTESIKYLGVDLFCEREKTISSIKHRSKSFWVIFEAK